jgi:hypothetical protein
MTKSKIANTRTRVVHVTTSDREINEAIARAKAQEPHVIRVTKVAYRLNGDLIVLLLASGVQVAVPRAMLQGLEHAKPDALRKIEIEGPGTGLHWPALGVDHYIPGLLAGIFGTRQWMAQLGRKGGNMRSPEKAAASRRNGQKGGRPRKHAAKETT